MNNYIIINIMYKYNVYITYMHIYVQMYIYVQNKTSIILNF